MRAECPLKKTKQAKKPPNPPQCPSIPNKPPPPYPKNMHPNKKHKLNILKDYLLLCYSL